MFLGYIIDEEFYLKTIYAECAFIEKLSEVIDWHFHSL